MAATPKTPKPRARSKSPAAPKATPKATTAAKSAVKKTPKTASKAATGSSSAASRKKASVKKAPVEEVEEIEAVELSDELKMYFEQFLFEMLVDSSVLHNVVRLQYLQAYVFALVLLGAAFLPEKVPSLPQFAGSSALVQGLAGTFSLAQAFSLTAAAQTSYSGMKKALQYNMFAHLIFAFVCIVLKDKTEFNVQLVVAVSSINVGLNLWACYFKEPQTIVDSDDEDEE